MDWSSAFYALTHLANFRPEAAPEAIVGTRPGCILLRLVRVGGPHVSEKCGDSEDEGKAHDAMVDEIYSQGQSTKYITKGKLSSGPDIMVLFTSIWLQFVRFRYNAMDADSSLGHFGSLTCDSTATTLILY